MDSVFLELLKARHVAYMFLSRAFTSPLDTAFMNDCGLAAKIFEIVTPGIKAGELLKLSEVPFDSFYFERLYASIFLTGACGFTVTPCESVYFSDEGLVMGDERDEILKIYCDNKFSLNPNFKEQEDHIGAELSFMAGMALRTDIESLKVQSDFLNNHLIRLTNRFALDMEKLDNRGLYHILSSIAKDFIAWDLNALRTFFTFENSADSKPLQYKKFTHNI